MFDDPQVILKIIFRHAKPFSWPEVVNKVKPILKARVLGNKEKHHYHGKYRKYRSGTK